VAQDVVVTEEDCGTVMGLEIAALKEGEDIIEPLAERIVGTVAADEVVDPQLLDEAGRPQLLVEAGEMIDEETATAIEEAGIETVKIRSVLTCEAKRGLCRMCYGRNLATMQMVDIGEAVGIISAQSIGEPGTQLTLRTFHIGGTAARIAEQTARKSKVAGFVEHGDRLVAVENAEGLQVVTSYEGELYIRATQDKNAPVMARLQVPLGAILMVQDGAAVSKEDVIFTWDPYTNPIIADVAGEVRFVDLVDEETISEELDELTGLRQRVVVEDREKKLHPHIEIWQTKGGKEKKVRDFVIPVGAQLIIEDGSQVTAGQTIAKISREAYKTRDITGGLPRVAELFEARAPKDKAILAEYTGTVSFGKDTKGKQRLVITDLDGTQHEELIPKDKHVLVHDGQVVNKGEMIVDGPVDPHDLLRLLGVEALARYIIDEVQDVYRLQGVKINDKHIEVIVRQMLRRVQIEDPGETGFIQGEQVERAELLEENEKAEQEGKKPATFSYMLLGITKASLSTDSFISAASFQETTRVLTEAAIMGKRDGLRGLKENVIVGRLIPAGTGMAYHKIRKDQAAEPPLMEAPIALEEVPAATEATAAGGN
jgi:DNA-directed RNA polymerase subunit beta'